MSARPDKKTVYEIISEQILKNLEAGTVPWRKPWKCQGGQRNIRGTAYRGINQFLLQCVAMDKGYSSPVWLTFNQARAAGGSVKKGEKGTPVVFWKVLKKEDKQADGSTKDKQFMMLRYYTVFSLEQCENVKVATKPEAAPQEPLAACEQVVAGMPDRPTIKEAGDRACYRPTTDEVFMPPRASFPKVEDFYSTLFHELGHATGAAKRLNRKGVTDPISFGSHQYGEEELVAEFTAAFLCGMTGISPQTVENAASYIDHWKRAVKLDEKLVVMACAQAQKAADLVMGANKKEEDEDEEEPAAKAA